MYHIRQHFILCVAAVFCLAAAAASAQEASPSMEVLISIADQKMAILRDGGLIQKFQVSTSRFGAGDAYRSYKTPLGQLKVCEKVGEDLTPGSVIKHRSATGEVLDVNAPGRDPIVTRILWLEGLEEQNRNAKERGIYIHGTPEEKKIGEPVSWGCIRMRSRDVVELYDEIPLGASVRIIAEHLPKLRKYEPPKPVIIAVRPPTPAPTAPPAVAPKIAALKVGPPVPMPSPALSRIAAAKQAPAATPLVAPARIAASKTPPKQAQTPAPVVASAKSAPAIAAAAPKRDTKPLSVIADGPTPPAAGPSSSGSDAGAFTAFKGSILFSGLPDGPTQKSISTSEPNKLLHAAPLTVATPGDGLGFH